jgi:hypothetical protein
MSSATLGGGKSERGAAILAAQSRLEAGATLARAARLRGRLCGESPPTSLREKIHAFLPEPGEARRLPSQSPALG